MEDRPKLPSRLRKTVRCVHSWARAPPKVLTVAKLDKALHSVRQDLSELWMSSRHQKGLAGIVSFCPTLEVRKAGKSIQSPQGKSAAPFVLSTAKPSSTRSPSPQPSPLKPANSRETVRVCSPNPSFPAKPSQRTYRLARIPSPLALRRRYQPAVSLKNSTDSNRLHYELGQFEVVERMSSPQGRGSVGEGCPLQAVRSFELQRLETTGALDGSRPTTGRNKSVVLRRYHERAKPQVQQKPEWSAACMTVKQLPHTSHQKSLSMPQPFTFRPWRAFRQLNQAAEAHSESSSDAQLFSGFVS